jgi:antitoxin YefM
MARGGKKRLIGQAKFPVQLFLTPRLKDMTTTLAPVQSVLSFRADITYSLTYDIDLEPIMPTLTASEARANLYRLIDQAAESHEAILISGKRRSAVLVSEEDWKAIQETLFLLSVPGMRESIKAGMSEPLAKSVKELDW